MKTHDRKENLERFLKTHSLKGAASVAPKQNKNIKDLLFMLAIYLSVPLMFSLFADFQGNEFSMIFLVITYLLCSIAIYLLVSSLLFRISNTYLFLMLLIVVLLLIALFSIPYSFYGVSIDSGVSHDKKDALYLSFITWTTVGYGDAVPVGTGRYFAMTQGIISYVVMGLMIAKLLNLMSRPNAKQR